MPRNLFPEAVALYAHLLPQLRIIAREHGYALGLHGSLTSDMDLIAAPWVDSASDPHKLIEAMRAHVGGAVNPKNPMKCRGCIANNLEVCAHVDDNPSKRSHGRLAFAIHLAGSSGPYLDVSVMPRKGA